MPQNLEGFTTVLRFEDVIPFAFEQRGERFRELVEALP